MLGICQVYRRGYKFSKNQILLESLNFIISDRYCIFEVTTALHSFLRKYIPNIKVIYYHFFWLFFQVNMKCSEKSG